MDLEFDKEIDALMRSDAALGGHSAAVGSAHPDADELAAFAENVVPEKTRAAYTAHLADCGRCRKILSQLILLNAESIPENAGAAAETVAETHVPWYRKLLLFPNLAYVLGGLVIVFGGLLTYSVLQNSRSDASLAKSTGETSITQDTAGSDTMTTTDVSNKSTNSNALVFEPSANSAAASNTAANAASNSARTASPSIGNPLAERELNVPADQLSESDEAAKPAAAQPPPPAKAVNNLPSLERDTRGLETRSAAPMPKDAPVSSTDLSRQDKREEKNDVAAAPKTTDEKAKLRAAGSAALRKKEVTQLQTETVAGRNFQFRNGAWYDTAYAGQTTVNIRRGTPEYRKLDGGLRKIAERLSGVVVIAWKGKAYRID